MFNTNFLAGAAGASGREMNLADELRNKQFQAAQFGANLGLQNRAMRQNVVNSLAQGLMAKFPGLPITEVYNLADKGTTSTGSINEKFYETAIPKAQFQNALNTNPGLGTKEAMQLGLQSGITDPKELEKALKLAALKQQVAPDKPFFGGGKAGIVQNKKGDFVYQPAAFDQFFANQQLQQTPVFPQTQMPQNVYTPGASGRF